MIVMDRPLGREARTLWEWHDGATPIPDREHTGSFGGFASFVSLNLAKTHYERLRTHWGDGLFPIAFKPLSAIVCDCSGNESAPCAVKIIDLGEFAHEPVTDRELPSIGSLFELWTEALERGYWKYAADGSPIEGEPWPELDEDLIPFVNSPERTAV